jgi:integrase
MSVFKRGGVWWYKFNWNGRTIRESTKISNKRIAQNIESARKTELAKGEVGIKDRAPIPTLKDFAERYFAPYIATRFESKFKTLEYYQTGLKNLNRYAPLANCALDGITAERIAGFVATRREAGLEVSTINRQLEVLRRMLKLAMEWGKVEKALPKVEMLPGENHRDRVLSEDEEKRYLEAATAIGDGILETYERALEGIRAAQRGQQPNKPEDAYLLRDAATILLDCGLRPEECFRLRWEQIRDGALHIPFGKSKNARRTIPLTQRSAALIEMRRAAIAGEWVFPAPTRSGHMEKSSLKRQHPKARKLAKIGGFPLYTFRHTCLTRWAAYMDPYTLAYLAGHADFATTRRYVHPQSHTIIEAIERARNAQGGHKNGHTPETGEQVAVRENALIQ